MLRPENLQDVYTPAADDGFDAVKARVAVWSRGGSGLLLWLALGSLAIWRGSHWPALWTVVMLAVLFLAAWNTANALTGWRQLQSHSDLLTPETIPDGFVSQPGVDGLLARIDQLGRQMAAGKITESEYRRQRAELMNEIASAENPQADAT